MPGPEDLIRARGLTKKFGEFTAVDGIDFDLRRGEAFGFLGPNGAGKSSTMRMIGCVSPPTGGERTILGLDAVADGPRIRARLGVVPQEDKILLLDEPTTGLDPQARHVVWDRLFRLKQRGVTLVLTTHYMDEAEQLCDRLVVMDNGKIAASGSPRELIERYSTAEVLELRFDPGEHEQAAEKVADVRAERTEVLADRILLYIPNGDVALTAVRNLGLEPLTSLVRRSTLEDVFLRLTGRRLED